MSPSGAYSPTSLDQIMSGARDRSEIGGEVGSPASAGAMSENMLRRTRQVASRSSSLLLRSSTKMYVLLLTNFDCPTSGRCRCSASIGRHPASNYCCVLPTTNCSRFKLTSDYLTSPPPFPTNHYLPPTYPLHHPLLPVPGRWPARLRCEMRTSST